MFSSRTLKTDIKLETEEDLKEENIEYNYEIYNNGPSVVKELQINFRIPTAFIISKSDQIPIIDFDKVRLKGTYIRKVFNWDEGYKEKIEKPHENNDISNFKPDKVFFNCSLPLKNIECEGLQLSVHNFRKGNEPIRITLNFPIDTKEACK